VRRVTAPTDEELITVEIVGLPISVQSQAQEQVDELTREMALIAEGMRQRGDEGALPTRLVTLVEQLSGRYSMFTVEQEKQLADAIAGGAETVDLTYRLPASAVLAARALSDILDEADDYCRAGKHLLTLATPEDLVRYRRWFLDQFADQAAGAAPVSWSEYVSTRTT
jgi:hypothetical protein